MMSRAKVREVRMLREVAHLLLPQIECWFCHKPLMDRVYKDHGHGTPPPIKALVTPSHRDGHPKGNVKKWRERYPVEKIDLVHRSCHKSAELKLRHETRKKGIANA